MKRGDRVKILETGQEGIIHTMHYDSVTEVKLDTGKVVNVIGKTLEVLSILEIVLNFIISLFKSKK